MPAPEPRSSLQRAGAEQTKIADRLRQLTQAELEQASNLPGWRVADLSVHVTRVVDSILLAVQRAIVGDKTPAFGPAGKAREEEIRPMGAAGWADLQARDYQGIVQIVAGLSSEQLEQCTFPHPSGERSVGWFCTQLLSETGFHRWDLERSLGSDQAMGDDLAMYLLPFLLHPARNSFAARRATGEPQTFCLSTEGGAWTLACTPEGTTVRDGASSEGATVWAPAGWLALAVYGRVRVDGPAFKMTGPPDAADRFAAIFGPSD